jgi:hypothetical protein
VLAIPSLASSLDFDNANDAVMTAAMEKTKNSNRKTLTIPRTSDTVDRLFFLGIRFEAADAGFAASELEVLIGSETLGFSLVRT